jgi:hypothetical protein
MGSISRAFALQQMGDYEQTAVTLRGLLDNVEASSEWVDVCEWIAICCEKMNEPEDAASWYESAGQMILAEGSVPFLRRIPEALYFFSKATECYLRGGKEKLAFRTRAIEQKLQQACAPA